MNEKELFESLLEWRSRVKATEDLDLVCPTTMNQVEDATVQIFEHMANVAEVQHVLYPVLALSVLRTLKEVLVDPNIWIYPCCEEEGKPINFNKLDKQEAFEVRVPPAFDLQCMEFAEAEHHHGYYCNNSIHYHNLDIKDWK